MSYNDFYDPRNPGVGGYDYTSPSPSNGFDYGSEFGSYGSPSSPPSTGPSIFNPIQTDPFSNTMGSSLPSDDPFADEPPLLEELGIDLDQICQKTMAVMNPLRVTNADILRDSDLAGPLVFCLAFGMFLLLSGKVTFGFIYGIGIVGCISMYCLLNLMAPGESAITLSCTVSVLGYCLLPMVMLSGISVVISLNGLVGTILSGCTILWCAVSSAKLFTTALSMHNQYALVLYPCFLVYGVFALLTVF